jgi:two-component system CheB/CheR fusion protein
MIVRETLEQIENSSALKIEIFASDLDKDVVEKARKGRFVKNSVTDISPQRLQRFFIKEEDLSYRIRPEIREQIVFSVHSLITDPPFTRMNFVSCRNVLIYLSQEMQQTIIPLFHFSLHPGGILMLGSAETIGSYSHILTTLDASSRIYSKSLSSPQKPIVDFPTLSPTNSGRGSAEKRSELPMKQNLQSLTENLILQEYSPATVLVDESGNILHISGRTGIYLEPAAGKANWNVFAMAREGLHTELHRCFTKALNHSGPVTATGLCILEEKQRRYVDIHIERLDKPDQLAGMLIIVFHPSVEPSVVKTSRRKRMRGLNPTRMNELEKELEASRSELRTYQKDMQRSREDLRATNEELQSTNEELQSTNEELQSSNEELTTSKEEMQSLNEELQTVNTELQEKLDELSRSDNDMKNLLNSTDIATLFLDNDLKVRRYTLSATKLIKLIPGDIGRPVTDLSIDYLYPNLEEDARDVLRNLSPHETTLQAKDDRWYTAKIHAYRTLDNRIDGVVVTFWDITESKRLEA